jgi:hypothetical protein
MASTSIRRASELDEQVSFHYEGKAYTVLKFQETKIRGVPSVCMRVKHHHGADEQELVMPSNRTVAIIR